MTTYNPYFLTPDPSSLYIPANPPAARLAIDPNRRDSVIHGQGTPAAWQAAKPRWSYSHGTGELESPYYMSEVEPREINRILSVAWENHGKDAVKAIVLWLSPECVNDQFSQLKFRGFERAEHREGKIPQICMVGPAKRWKE